MSNPYLQPQPNPYGAPAYGPPRPQENTLGLIGFIVSLAGFFVCIAAPVGLMLSVMGLRREPKGFAVAGTIIGTLAMLMWLGVVAIYGAVILACIGFGAAVQPDLQTRVALQSARHKIENVRGPGGRIPVEAEGNGLIQGMQDYWKRQLRYEPKEGGFNIRSAGPDGQFNTSDDIVVDDFGSEFGSPSFDAEPSVPQLPDVEQPGSLFPEPESKPLIPLDETPKTPEG